MNKIPTAKELRNKYEDKWKMALTFPNKVEELMIEHTKLHVEAALQAASKTKIKGNYTNIYFKRDYDDKESILNAYPLENIK